MKKLMFIAFLMLFSCVGVFADNINPEEDPNAIPVPSLDGTVFDPAILPLTPGTVPTIPTLDPMHAPLIRNNLFGIDFSNWIGAEGTEVTGRTSFKSKDKWYGMDAYGEKGTTSIGVNYKFPTTESLGGTFFFDMEYHDFIGGGTPSMYNSSYSVYRLYFQRSYYQGQKNETRLTVGHNYYDLRGDNGNDGQEFGAGLAFPKFFKWSKFNLVPSGYLGYVWNLETQTDTGVTINKFDGMVAQVGLDLYFSPDKDAENFLFDFYTKLNYNDDADSNGEKIAGEFTDVTVGASVDFELAKGLIATPSVNYVHYFDDNVNDGEGSDIWTGLTVRYNF